MADYTSLKAAIASVIKTNGNQEITGLLLQQTLHSMLDGVNTTKQDTINFVLNTANKFLRDDGSFQEILSPAGGFANNLYFTNVDSPIVTGYKSLSYTPDSTAVNINASVTAAEGEKVVQTYIYPSGVSVDLFPSGLWSFNFYGNIDLTVGVTQLGVQYFKRSTAGVETNLFTAWSEELNNTIPKWIPFEATNPSFIVDPTDRMGARILVKTTSTPAVNVTFVIGDGYAAYLNNPNRIRHSQLRDWNGDTNYLHITQTEKTNFQTAYYDRMKWDGGSSGLNAVTGRESLGLRIGIDVLAYRTFGSAANNNTNDFLAYNGVAVDSSKLGGQLPSYYQTNITAGTSLQYYRGDKTMQTLDTSVVPENSNMYFTYPRVLATALTGYAAGANTALSATDTILAAMGKIQGQINARALASDLSGHINNTTIHLTADEKTYLGKIMTYLKVAVDNTSMYSTINFYSESGVSAYGIGTGGGGGAGVDIIDDLLSVRADAALSANQGRILKGFVDLKQPQLNGLGFVKANGTSISYDNNSYALASSLSDYLLKSGGTMTGVITTPNSTYGIIIGDDSRLADRNVSNTLFLEGNQNTDRGYINFSMTSGNALGAINGGNLTWRDNVILHAGNYSSYALPLSGGILTGRLYTRTIGTYSHDGAIEIGERDGVGAGQSSWSYAPRIAFHWGGRYVKAFGMRSDGQFAIADTDILIHSGNIGSQSVNYAASAGNADTLGNLSKDYFIKTRQGYIANMNNAGNYLGNSTFYWTPDTIGSAGGYGVCLALSDGISWYNQLGFSTGGDIVFRQAINTADFTGIGWAKLYHTGNLTNTLSNGYLPYWNGSSLTDSIVYMSYGYAYIKHPSYSAMRFGEISGMTGIFSAAAVGIRADGGLKFLGRSGDVNTSPDLHINTSGVATFASTVEVARLNVVNGNKSIFMYNNGTVQKIVAYDYGVLGQLPIVIGDDGAVVNIKGTVSATTAILTNLTDGYIPYHISDASGLGNSIISQSGNIISVAGEVQSTLGAHFGTIGNSNTLSAILGGYGISNGSVRYGRYGQLLFNAGTDWTAGARKWLITNAHQATKFAIIRSVDTSTNPSLGINGEVSSGIVDLSISNIGNIGIGYTDRTEKLAVAGSGYFENYVESSSYLRGYKVISRGNSGFQNDIWYANVANPIWSFGNATGYGLAYYQGSALAVGDAIGFHFGDRANPQFYVASGGGVWATTGTFSSTLSAGNTTSTTRHYFYANQSSYGVIHLVSATSETSIGYRKPSGSGGWTVGRGIGGSEYFGWWNDDANATRMYLSTTGALWTASYIESASYLKATSIKIGANWEAIPNGTDLELRYGGVMKAKLSASGDILAVGGVTAFAV